jgi:hypothetical protein
MTFVSLGTVVLLAWIFLRIRHGARSDRGAEPLGTRKGQA